METRWDDGHGGTITLHTVGTPVADTGQSLWTVGTTTWNMGMPLLPPLHPL